MVEYRDKNGMYHFGIDADFLILEEKLEKTKSNEKRRILIKKFYNKYKKEMEGEKDYYLDALDTLIKKSTWKDNSWMERED